MFVKNQTFLILGVSKSGYSASKYLIKKGARCYLYDDSEDVKTLAAITELENLGAVRITGEETDRVLREVDAVIISPGVPINHEIAVKAKSLNKKIIGELEFGFNEYMPTIVAVTGTNGKTTTVSLIGYILEKEGIKHALVGNIGVPITSVMENYGKDTVFVTEVSSFQLESVSSFCPHISCVLNLAPDHLERHFTMENYAYLKKRIMKNQRESEYALLNYDDSAVREFGSDTRAKVVWVSCKERVKGCYLSDGKIYYNDEYVADASSINIVGAHNVYNALFAVACALLLGVSKKAVEEGLSGFHGVKHRLERIAEHKGITYYNDSKSTNTASCITAIDYIKTPFVLILGGSEKGEEYDVLFNRLKSSGAKSVVITGASRYNMLSSANKTGFDRVTVTEDFYMAIKIAYMSAESGDSVLFSPACASFDRFSGYGERGDEFVKTVEKLIENDK